MQSPTLVTSRMAITLCIVARSGQRDYVRRTEKNLRRLNFPPAPQIFHTETRRSFLRVQQIIIIIVILVITRKPSAYAQSNDRCLILIVYLVEFENRVSAVEQTEIARNKSEREKLVITFRDKCDTSHFVRADAENVSIIEVDRSRNINGAKLCLRPSPTIFSSSSLIRDGVITFLDVLTRH